MPTYEYACRDCGHHLEAVQSFTDDPLTQCPACGGRLRKKFSAAGIIFKGSGYYVTDSRATKAKSGDASSDAGAGTAASKEKTPAGSGAAGGSKSGGSPAPGSPAAGSSSTGGSGSD